MAKNEIKDFAARAAFLDDDTIADEVVAAQAATKTARSHVCEQAKSGLSQKEVALRMGVSQSKVCRMEDALDADLSYGDIESYVHALDLNVSLFYDAVTASRETLATNFANAIADLIDKLRSLLPEDSRYNDAIDRFSGGVLFPIVRGQKDVSFCVAPAQHSEVKKRKEFSCELYGQCNCTQTTCGNSQSAES